MVDARLGIIDFVTVQMLLPLLWLRSASLLRGSRTPISIHNPQNSLKNQGICYLFIERRVNKSNSLSGKPEAYLTFDIVTKNFACNSWSGLV